ncbi:Alkylated DNA repair protein alkB 8 [Linnemannia zychae]|nr:Alkylated DNA repair protein alkB 8 [Linnemannia zychae]
MSTKNPLHIPSPFQADQPDMTPEEKEQQYVHSVYQAIAPHFSATRYKPWPVVEEFLKTMPTGYVGADVGCGNGKYIGVNDKLFMVGSDSICGERGHEAMVCDGLALPYRPRFFDFAISIAVIHHFISPERRKAAIEEILRIVRVGGRVLIFVWALEQTGKRDFDKETQDVFVPWALAKKPAPGGGSGETKAKKKKEPKANSRPQGVKKKDRKENGKIQEGQTVSAAAAQDEQADSKGQEEGLVVTESLSKLTIQDNHTDGSNSRGDKDNSTIDNSLQQDQSSTADSLSSSVTTPAAIEAHPTDGPKSEETPVTEAPVFNRYYHLFHKGELEDLVLQTNKATIVQQGYDRDNWWCILEKTHHE